MTPCSPVRAICGSSGQVLERIAEWDELLGLERLAVMFDLGGIPEPALCETIERFGTEVLPKLTA